MTRRFGYRFHWQDDRGDRSIRVLYRSSARSARKRFRCIFGEGRNIQMQRIAYTPPDLSQREPRQF